MSGLVGDVPLPTSGAFTFAYGAETATTSGSDVGFAGPTLKPKRCSGVVDISKKIHDLNQQNKNILFVYLFLLQHSLDLVLILCSPQCFK